MHKHPRTHANFACRQPADTATAWRVLIGLISGLMLGLGTASCAGADEAHPGFVGTRVCAGCHESAYEQWQGSHHDLAMQAPSADTVLGDFQDARFDHFGMQTDFYTRGDEFFVRTDGRDGKPREFKVAWVFGVYPLQQYLLPLENGALQALSVAWDSRPAEQGGQRWYHLYPDEAIRHDDPLHWTGPYQNWNTRCAECHSTDLQKNYLASERRFETRFFEENVGCEACHGPGATHVKLATSGELENAALSGLVTQLAAQGTWHFAEGASIAQRMSPNGHPQQTGVKQPDLHLQQIDSCGRCHARRGTLGDYVHGQPLADTHRLSLLGDPLYHADGQILDEVYVYGSFVQSKMHQAGVVCSNCHEPHSNQLRAPGNGVCAQCHVPATFDTPEHHHHAAGTAAGQCVSCHMPAQTYMGVDARRDHSMRIPRPDLSLMAGTPNACNSCHSDESADWALDALADWGVRFTDTAQHPAVAMAALQKGDNRGVPTLLTLAADSSAAPIWRATALERIAAVGDRGGINLAQELLNASDPLLRVSAVRALQQLPVAQRYARLTPLVGDPVTGVRMEVAMALAAVPIGELDDPGRRALLTLFSEYTAIQKQHAEMPSIQMQLGLFHSARGDAPAAEAAYREALHINPQLIAAQLNLADLLRSLNREEEAREELESALRTAPGSGDAMHALGLLEARRGNQSEALKLLAAAAEAETQGARHRFVYAVAQHDFGDLPGALTTLRRLHSALPADEQTLLALSNYTAESGDRNGALRFAKKLVALAPNNVNYRRMAAALGGE